MRDTLRHLRTSLRRIYPPREAEAMIRLIFEHLKGWVPVDLALHEQEPLSDFMKGKVEGILERLMRHEPIQYVTGRARFYGLDLAVSPAVLIPRPETEELVEMITRESEGRPDLRVLDAGTGSGCIALALARNLRFPQVTAIDVSREALEVARANAKALRCRVDFRQEDMLALPAQAEKWDIIVSNPPYVDRSEAAQMEANVLEHEPHSALFVPDEDPLLFYRALGEYGIRALVPGGRMYLEINPRHVGELVTMLEGEGYAQVESHRDMCGRERFMTAMRPGEAKG